MAQYILEPTDLASEELDSLNRLYELSFGIKAHLWPRFNGQRMQPLLVLDLEAHPIDVPAARGKRAMVVFADSYYESPVYSTDGLAVVWLSESDISKDIYTPADYVAEPKTDDFFRAFGVEKADGSEIPDGCHSFIGGSPVFENDKPSKLPKGKFVLQGDFLSVSRDYCSVLYVFEHGCMAIPEFPDEALPNWSVALKQTQEISIYDKPPDEGEIVKWGGVPAGVSDYAWPTGMTHLFTLPWSDEDDDDVVAMAVFSKLAKDKPKHWRGELGFFDTCAITKEAVEETKSALPNPKEVLPEKTLTLSQTTVSNWRELPSRSFIGPRFALRDLPSDDGIYPSMGINLQIGSELLPHAPSAGTAYWRMGGYPVWQAADDAGVSADPEDTEELVVSPTTLYEESTCAALVCGYQIDFEDSQLEIESLESIAKAVGAINQKHGYSLTTFVTGDTAINPDDTCFSSVVVGMPLVMTNAWDEGPNAFDPTTFAERIKKLPVLDDGDMDLIVEQSESPVASVKSPDVYLMSWGHLCYGALHVGVPMPESEKDNAQYKYSANQDMEQAWSPQGLDGVFLESVEFGDIAVFDYSERAVNEALAKADKLSDPRFFLLCRYD